MLHFCGVDTLSASLSQYLATSRAPPEPIFQRERENVSLSFFGAGSRASYISRKSFLSADGIARGPDGGKLTGREKTRGRHCEPTVLLNTIGEIEGGKENARANYP